MNCYIIFARSQRGHHVHVIVTQDPSFKTPEERFDQLGPLEIEPELGDAEIGERIVDAMNYWLALPENAKYIEESARPVAVFHDAHAHDPITTSTVLRHVVDCIAAVLYKPANPHEVTCKAYTLDPLIAAQFCR